MLQHVFVNSVQVYQGEDAIKAEEVLALAVRVIGLTGATAKIEIYEDRVPAREYRYLLGKLMMPADKVLKIDVAENIKTNERLC